jgi:hypothetical protein
MPVRFFLSLSGAFKYRAWYSWRYAIHHLIIDFLGVCGIAGSYIHGSLLLPEGESFLVEQEVKREFEENESTRRRGATFRGRNFLSLGRKLMTATKRYSTQAGIRQVRRR